MVGRGCSTSKPGMEYLFFAYYMSGRGGWWALSKLIHKIQLFAEFSSLLWLVTSGGGASRTTRCLGQERSSEGSPGH